MKKILLSTLLLSCFAFANSDGATIFTKCAGCHGTLAEKDALGKKTVLKGVSSEEIQEKLLGYKEGKLNKFGMGAVMKGQVTSLSDEDIKVVSDYISTLK